MNNVLPSPSRRTTGLGVFRVFRGRIESLGVDHRGHGGTQRFVQSPSLCALRVLGGFQDPAEDDLSHAKAPSRKDRRVSDPSRLGVRLLQGLGNPFRVFRVFRGCHHEVWKTGSTGEWGQKNRAILLSPFFCRLDRARSPNMPNPRRKHRESLDNRRESLRSSSLRLSHLLRCFTAWEGFFEGKTGLELGGKQGREREAVPPRLPSGWAAGLDLDRLRGVFREPDGTTA